MRGVFFLEIFWVMIVLKIFMFVVLINFLWVIFLERVLRRKIFVVFVFCFDSYVINFVSWLVLREDCIKDVIVFVSFFCVYRGFNFFLDLGELR